MKSFKDLLIELDACEAAIQWSGDKKIEQVVAECHRGDWLLWLAKKIDIDFKLLTLSKGHCAATVIHLMKDERSKKAVQAAIDFGRGLITDNDLKNAANAANAAYADANAAHAAAYADANAAYAAAYADANAAYAAAYAAKKENEMTTANICREIIGNQIIELVNKNLLIEKTYQK